MREASISLFLIVKELRKRRSDSGRGRGLHGANWENWENWSIVVVRVIDWDLNLMTTRVNPSAFPPIAELPLTPASDLKKLGWRGLMKALRSKGTLLVTNHDEPEAVIIPVEDYHALMQLVDQSKAHTERALQGLRQEFDVRLAVLQDESASTRLRSTLEGGAKLHGKVKAGSSY